MIYNIDFAYYSQETKILPLTIILCWCIEDVYIVPILYYSKQEMLIEI